MKSDNEFYIIQKFFPNNFVKLAKMKCKSTYKQHSIELKALKDTKDSFFIPEDKNDPIIVIENQGYSERNFFLRFNQGVSIFCYQNDYYGDVIKVAVFLKKEHFNNSIMPKHYGNFICYILSEMTKEELESFNDDVLMSLLPLCKVTEKEVINYTNVWKNKVEKNESIKHSDKLTLYGIYSYFCNETFNKSINQINEILGVDIMITKLGKELFEKGKEEGIKKGREEGREEGIEKGREEGIKKGREEGREEGIEKGREEGIEKGILALKKLYKKGIINKQIYLEEIENLKQGKNPNSLRKRKQKTNSKKKIEND